MLNIFDILEHISPIRLNNQQHKITCMSMCVSCWKVFELKRWQMTATCSLIVSWSFSRKDFQTNWNWSIRDISCEINRTKWDVRFTAIHTIMWLWNNWGADGGEGYLTDQPWSPVAAQSVIVNTCLHHVNCRACLFIHSFTYEWQHVNAPLFTWARIPLHISWYTTLSHAHSCI